MCSPVEDRKLSVSVNADSLYTADSDFIKLCFQAASLQSYQPFHHNPYLLAAIHI